MTDVSGQVAVITGASSGIGRAVAQRLAAMRATLCLVGRRLDALQSVAASVPAVGQRVQCFQADLGLDEDVRELVLCLRRDLERVDLLIHSAGVISLGRVESQPVEELDRLCRVNVRAPYMLTQALLPMIKACQGQIVFINSSVSLTGAKADLAPYSASKHALKAIADGLRDEVNADGVRVVSVYPGRTASPMQEALHRLEGKPYHPERLLQPDDVASVVVHALSQPRSAEVTDISVRPMVKPVSRAEGK